MNTEPCPVCTKYGLPVMPARYTVVPEELNVRELSFSGERVVDVPAQGVKYAARVLRQGYLYVYYEKNHLGAKRWQVYSVSPEGKLHRQSGTASARLVDKTEVCSRCGSAGFNKDFFVIEEPQKCATTWLAFSEHKWSDAIVQRYQDDAGLRARRMQKIELGRSGLTLPWRKPPVDPRPAREPRRDRRIQRCAGLELPHQRT